MLSEKLATQMGQKNVMSIDFEKKVVTDMSSRGVDGVTYKEMDMTHMGFEDGSFDFVLDKGSFDALCIDQTKKTKDKCKKYLAEVMRVLDKDGHFVCVSLLQNFVFDALLEFFNPQGVPIKPSTTMRITAI
jgi:ubiquinone/menaquinone biosynthesis C-methylase UbiE